MAAKTDSEYRAEANTRAWWAARQKAWEKGQECKFLQAHPEEQASQFQPEAAK